MNEKQLNPNEEIDLYFHESDGVIALLEGDYRHAILSLKKLYDYTHKKGDKMGSSANARRLGYAYLYLGDPESARIYLRESMIDNHALGDQVAVSACLYAYGTLAEKTGDVPRSACLHAAAIKAMISTGLPTLIWDTQIYESSLKTVQSQLDQPELAAMWAKGEAMTLEQAMAYALDE